MYKRWNIIILKHAAMPSLPLDLERLIFEMAALQDTNRNGRVRIMLVAKRVHEWIRPILYRVAIVKIKSQNTIGNWGKAQMTELALFARHLLLIVDTEADVLKQLSTFRNIENLAIWHLGFTGAEILKKLNDLPLRMLSINLGGIHIDEAIQYCPALKNVTHLELLDLKGRTWGDNKALVGFPKLTHLCFDVSAEVEVEVVLHLLEHCSSLRVLICLLTPGMGCTIESEDPRFLVFQDDMLLESSIGEWSRSANGRVGCWELADMIVGARSDKLFKDNSLFTFSRWTWMDRLNDDGMWWYIKKVDK